MRKILKDTFELNGFDHHHLVSDLSRRRQSGVSTYNKHHLKPLLESVEIFPNQVPGIHVLFANFKTKLRVAVLYAKLGSNDDDIIDEIDESFGSKNRDYKIVLAGDSNIDMGTELERVFCKIMDEIYCMTLRNNIAQYTTRSRMSIDAVFSTHSARESDLYDSVFSHQLSLYVQVSWDKKKTSYSRSTRRRRSKAGVWVRSMKFCRTN
ncbi:uncharacterized protein CDAR_392991 [Caerostris darwini]|uniref:Uncharacterized protein n=1 Tax=Caerostris darwini TaxID=1538125 RepID=A0AAV4PWF7_9ARAC|nr:uncharacterized protein CDAR_392991 [Caerostris darwini]